MFGILSLGLFVFECDFMNEVSIVSGSEAGRSAAFPRRGRLVSLIIKTQQLVEWPDAEMISSRSRKTSRDQNLVLPHQLNVYLA